MSKLLKYFLVLLPLAGCQQRSPPEPPVAVKTVTLEEQLATLDELGLKLNEGVTIDDLLHSWDLEEYEKQPYDLVLFALGSEVERAPWGRPVCDRVWNLDAECIEGPGDYVTIVENLCRVAAAPNLITDIEDSVDLEAETAWLKYTVDGQQRNYEIPVDNDQADPNTVAAIMSDIARDGKHFYSKDNGQSSIWFYLDPGTATKLNELTNNALNGGR